MRVGSGASRTACRADPSTVRHDFGGRIVHVDVASDGAALTVFMDGGTYEFAMPDPLGRARRGFCGRVVIDAPMPGRITFVSTAAGSRGDQGRGVDRHGGDEDGADADCARAAAWSKASQSRAGDQVVEGAVLRRADAAEA